MDAGLGYPARQLAQALATATGHEDAATQRRAERRVEQWQGVLEGMATGQVSAGSRTPVAGLPAWVTPEVVRGGFATGTAAAGGELTAHEVETAERVSVPATREALFAYHLTEQGLDELSAMLDSGHYTVEVPEEAALLTVAWLARAGDRDSALTLLDTLRPFAGRLRFCPRPSAVPPPDSHLVWRQSTGEVTEALRERAPNPRVLAMNEALSIWNPFADELLELWLQTRADGVVAEATPPGWPQRASILLQRYAQLALAHPFCSKHRRPKENLAILRVALEDVVAGHVLDRRRLGMLQHAVNSMVTRRGRPGSEQHARLRRVQATDAGRSTQHAVAQVVIARLSALPQDIGLAAVEFAIRPIEAGEPGAAGGPLTGGDQVETVPAATAVPAPIQRVVDRATAGTIDELVAAGKVPSGEALAELVPAVVALTTASGYPDEALRRLAACVHRAFSARRSLLLLNLAHQVRAEELPWVQAVAAHRRIDGSTRCEARAVLTRIACLALVGYPGTMLPNPLVGQLSVLARAAELRIPLVEELAADIFVGRFSKKFAAAAIGAARLLSGTVYERYYGIDYAAILRKEKASGRWWQQGPFTAADWFSELCAQRAGPEHRRRSVAARGLVIEQSQILTTANLAALVDPIGVVPPDGWVPLARHAFRDVARLIDQLPHTPRPLHVVKDAAYAWRQVIFYLSLCPDPEQISTLSWAREQLPAASALARPRLTELLDGLELVLAANSVPHGQQASPRRPFLGWTMEAHWMLSAQAGIRS